MNGLLSSANGYKNSFALRHFARERDDRMRVFCARAVALIALLPLVACSGEAEDPDGGAGESAAGGGQVNAGSGGRGGTAGISNGGTVQPGEGAGTAGTGRAGSNDGGGGKAGGGAGSGGAAGSASGSGGETAGGRATGGGSGAGKGGAAGSGGMTPGLDTCPMPPDGSPAAAIIALNTENAIRLAMGLDCAELVPELITSAQNHCNYYTANDGDDMCEAPSPHDEIEGCPEFTGEGLGDRLRAAGYELSGSANECMAFTGDPERSTMMFVDSVYHRTPVLDPWIRELGYGSTENCDTIDYGTGERTDTAVTAHYPYAGQTGVPTAFDGSREGPEPPEPSSGWPSGYPVTLYARELEVTSHSIRVDGSEEELAHLWLAEDDDTLPSYAKVLYTEAPLAANTTYRVVIEGTRDGEPLDFDFTFTTGAASGGGRPRP
jgi:hypothetical protein